MFVHGWGTDLWLRCYCCSVLDPFRKMGFQTSGRGIEGDKCDCRGSRCAKRSNGYVARATPDPIFLLIVHPRPSKNLARKRKCFVRFPSSTWQMAIFPSYTTTSRCACISEHLSRLVPRRAARKRYKDSPAIFIYLIPRYGQCNVGNIDTSPNVAGKPSSGSDTVPFERVVSRIRATHIVV